MGASAAHLVNTTVRAGLPNITGTLNSRASDTPNSVLGAINGAQGVFTVHENSESGFSSPVSVPVDDTHTPDTVSFNASRSSSVYGNSTTVQPATYYIKKNRIITLCVSRYISSMPGVGRYRMRRK